MGWVFSRKSKTDNGKNSKRKSKAKEDEPSESAKSEHTGSDKVQIDLSSSLESEEKAQVEDEIDVTITEEEDHDEEEEGQVITIDADDVEFFTEQASKAFDTTEIARECAKMTESERERCLQLRSFLLDASRNISGPDRAWVLQDLSLVEAQLEDAQAALKFAREAHRAAPANRGISRTYHLAALRAEEWDDAIAALASEAQRSDPSEKEAHIVARARILSDRKGDDKAAIDVYRTSATASLDVSFGIEAISITNRDWYTAAKVTEAAAEASTSARFRAELFARSARHCLRGGAVSSSVEAMEKSLSAGALSNTTAVTMERIAGSTKDLSRLVEVREWLLANDGDDPVALRVDLGLIARYRLGKIELAQRMFQEVALVDEGPAKKLALEELVEIHESLGAWSELAKTLEALAECCESPTRKAELLTQLGDVWSLQLKNEARAITAYQGALTAVPDWGRALEGAGRVHRRRDDKKALIAMHRGELMSAINDESRQEPARRLGELLIESAVTLEEGIELLLKVLHDTKYRPSVFRLLERAMASSESWTALLELYENEASHHQGNKQAEFLHRAASVARNHLGDNAAAIALLQQIQDDQEPILPRHLVELGRLFREESDWAGLARHLEQMDDRYPDLIDGPLLLAELAEARNRSGDRSGTIDAYLRACEIAPPNSPVLQTAGRYCLDEGLFSELAMIYQQVAEREQGDLKSFWLTRAGEVFSDFLGDRNAAISLLQSAVRHGSTRALPTLDRALAVEGRWQELFQLRADQEDLDSPVRRGAIAEALGDTGEALHCYEQAFEQGDAHIRVTLDRMRIQEGEWQALLDTGSDMSQYRTLLAAEVASDELDDSARSREFVDMLCDEDRAELGISLWELEREPTPEDRELALANSASWQLDRPAQAYFQRAWADALEAQGKSDKALALRMELLQEHGWNSASSAQVEVALESRRQHKALVDVIRLSSGQNQSPELTSALQSRLGSLYQQLGLFVEAQRSWQNAVSASEGSLPMTALIGLASTSDRLDGEEGKLEALQTAADRIPLTWVKALCHWSRGQNLTALGEHSLAQDAYLRALEAEPTHRPSLSALAESLAESDESSRLIAPLMRAFEGSAATGDLIELGRCLATALIQEGRLDAALEVSERLFSHSSTEPKVCMLLFEVSFRLGNYRRAATLAKSLSLRDDVDDKYRSSAAARYAELANTQLSAKEEALEWLTQLEQQKEGLEVTDLVKIYRQCEVYEKAAGLLSGLVDSCDGEERNRYLWQQADLYQQLGDSEKAIKSLSLIQGASDRNELLEHLLILIDGDENPASGCVALRNALAAGHEGLKPSLELRARRYLIANSSDEKKGGAIPHLERVVILAPEDIAAIEKLAMYAAKSDPKSAIGYHAALLAKRPERNELYRAIRNLCVETEDNDGAFIVEAALMGLGTANEEESYFYRQRLPQLSTQSPTQSDGLDLDALAPDVDPGLLVVLRELQGVANQVLPVDWAGYGLDANNLPGPGSLEEDFQEVALALGIKDFRLAEITTNTAPAVEQDTLPTLLVPDSVSGKSKRHRQCIAAALLARVRFHGILGAPSALGAASPKQLEYLIGGAVLLARGKKPTDAGAIFRDLYKRLDQAMDAPARKGIAEAFTGDKLPVDCGAQIIDAMNQSAAKTALLFARDPAVAISCFQDYPALIGDLPGDSAPGANAIRTLAFSVSRAHRQLRGTLRLGLNDE